MMIKRVVVSMFSSPFVVQKAPNRKRPSEAYDFYKYLDSAAHGGRHQSN